MDNNKKDYKEPGNPWVDYKDHWTKCLCKECTPWSCKDCKCKHYHPSVKPKESTPVLTVEEAVQVYRNAKAVTKQVAEDLQQAKELLAKLQLDHTAALNEETRAKATLDRAFEEEAKNA
jgi:hypothetical protein